MFDKIPGIKPPDNEAPSSPEADDDAGVILSQSLEHEICTLDKQQTAEELKAATEDAFTDLRDLYHQGLSRQQTAALDRTLYALQQVYQLAGALSVSGEDKGFKLSALMNEICSLCTETASRRGIELVPLVFDDLADDYRAPCAPLRTLLYMLCSAMIPEIRSGALIIRAMLDDKLPNEREEEWLLITLEPQEGSETSPPPPLPRLATHIAKSIGAEISPGETSLMEIRIKVCLHRQNQSASGQSASAPISQPVAFHHPHSIARHALGQQLHRLRFETREAQAFLGLAVDNQEKGIAAMVLALPTNFDNAEVIAATKTLAPLPVVILCDASPLSTGPNTTWLPRCVGDARLERTLTKAIRRHRLTQPLALRATDEAAHLTGGDKELGERLFEMLIEELAETLRTLHEHIRLGDREGLKEAVHKLKGGASYCGVPALHQAAVVLDQVALTAPLPQLELFLERLRGEANTLLRQSGRQ